MIFGIGIDIVKIERMKEAHEKWGRRFFERILSEEEIAYCLKKKEPYPSLAVRFAAKEALIKATGADIPVSMKDIEVVNNGKGKPLLGIQGELGEFFKMNNIKHSHLSLSHEREFGVACVVLEC